MSSSLASRTPRPRATSWSDSSSPRTPCSSRTSGEQSPSPADAAAQLSVALAGPRHNVHDPDVYRYPDAPPAVPAQRQAQPRRTPRRPGAVRLRPGIRAEVRTLSCLEGRQLTRTQLVGPSSTCCVLPQVLGSSPLRRQVQVPFRLRRGLGRAPGSLSGSLRHGAPRAPRAQARVPSWIFGTFSLSLKLSRHLSQSGRLSQFRHARRYRPPQPPAAAALRCNP